MTKEQIREILLSETNIRRVTLSGKWCYHGSEVIDYFIDNGIEELYYNSNTRRFEIERYLKNKATQIYLSVRNTPKYIFRAIYVDHPSKINTLNLGKFWSSSPDTNPCSKWTETNIELLLRCNYRDNNINWEETIRSRSDWLFGDKEDEYYLEKDSVNDIDNFTIIYR